MKRFLALILALVMVFCVTACGAQEAPAPEAEAPEAEAPEAEAPEAEAPAEEEYEVAVLIKGTDSSFWQKVGEGGTDYGEEHGVKVTVQGPPNEAAIEESLSLLENVILAKPDAIVLGSNADAGATAAIAEAKAAGIPVVTVDTALPSEDVVCHLATDNIKGGQLAAEAMVKYMTDNNIPLKGKVGIVAAVAGVQTIIDRDGGFIEKMKELAPEIEVIDPIYVDNDIEKSMAAAENMFTTYGDELVGIYADNNHTGDGVAKAVEQAGLQDKVTVVAFDDDQEELDALKNNVIKALIIQDQHNMGYSGVEYALKALKGELDTDYVDTGVVVTWPEDLK